MRFQGLSRALKNGKHLSRLSRTFKEEWAPCYTHLISITETCHCQWLKQPILWYFWYLFIWPVVPDILQVKVGLQKRTFLDSYRLQQYIHV